VIPEKKKKKKKSKNDGLISTSTSPFYHPGMGYQEKAVRRKGRKGAFRVADRLTG
jgi:hypothetical protein